MSDSGFSNENEPGLELQHETQSLPEENNKFADANTWSPTGEIVNLSTKIHKNYTLPKTTRTNILKTHPRNLRQQQSLKIILPTYTPSHNNEEVFGETLKDIIEKENTTNKYPNEAKKYHKRSNFGKGNNKFNNRPAPFRSNPQGDKNHGPLQDRPIHEYSKCATPTIFFEIPGSVCNSSRCFKTRLEQAQELVEPSLDFNPQNTEKSIGESSDHLHNRALWRTAAWFSLRKKNFSSKIIEMVEKSTNKSLNNTVRSAIKKWNVWCNKHDMNPICCPINSIVEFLKDMNNESKSYNTIAGYHSAISEVHDEINNVKVERYPDVAKIMYAIGKINHPPLHQKT
ncbi:9929_t:CDS:2 [Gigaspora rosea]|nr:9929_t:CDS:2 [Gigaspora rosea]